MAKFKKINFKSKSLWKKIGLGVLAGVVLIGAVFGVTALFRKAEEETQKEISPSYAIGGLTEDGAYLETKESIYTKDAFECKGLNVKLAFDNNISYRIFFYDYGDNFVSSTSKLTTNYDEDVSIFVKSARIVITPNEDSKISWYEKSGYAKQLTISVDKDQDSVPKTYELNMANIDLIDGMINGSTWKSSGSVSVVCQSGMIDLDNFGKYSTMTIYNTNGYKMYLAFLTEEPVLEEKVSFSIGHSLVTTEESSVTFNIPSDAKYFVYRDDYSTVESGFGPARPSSIVFSK